MTRARGFTLVELLVAVALFATVAAMAYGGLDAIARHATQLEEASTRLTDVQRTWNIVARDLRQAARRGVRDLSGERLPALAGERLSVELTRRGYGNALGAVRAELERVAYRREDDALVRLRYDVLDRADSSRPRRDVLIDGVTGFDLRYLTRDGRTHDAWPIRGAGDDALPAAVEVRIAFADYGEMRRVLELTDAVVDEAAP